MHNRSILILPLLILSVSCVEIATFLENGSPSISQPEEYVSLVKHPQDYQGQSLRMAGRMVGIEKQKQGSLIIAEFMLLPGNPSIVISESYQPTRHLRFSHLTEVLSSSPQ